MTDQAYYEAAERALRAVEDALERDGLDVELDIDIARRGKLLELSFENRSQIVINLQPPLQELWLASKDGAYHFKLDENSNTWRDTRAGADFFALLEAALKSHTGQSISLTRA
jgi:CyaY protein